MAACLIPRFPECCTTAALASPAAQELSWRAVRLLDALRFSLLLPGSLPPLQAGGACAVMLTYTHIAVGLFLPALAAALAEAALFQRRQRQRRLAGLPPERGWDAVLYGACGACWRLTGSPGWRPPGCWPASCLTRPGWLPAQRDAGLRHLTAALHLIVLSWHAFTLLRKHPGCL